MKDFFISYTSSDEKYAKWIAELLEKNGYTTIIQAWDFRPGDNFVSKINEALTSCKKMIIVLSENYMKSNWCQAEWTSKIADQIKNGTFVPDIEVMPAGIFIVPILQAFLCLCHLCERAVILIQHILCPTGMEQLQRPLLRIERLKFRPDARFCQIRFIFTKNRIFPHGDKLRVRHICAQRTFSCQIFVQRQRCGKTPHFPNLLG